MFILMKTLKIQNPVQGGSNVQMRNFNVERSNTSRTIE